MKNVEFGFVVIRDQQTLKKYLEKLKVEQRSPVELRYIAYTAMNGEQSFIARIINKRIQSELLTPHFWYAPYQKKRIIRKEQGLSELIRKGLQKEAHLELKRFRKITTVSVENTNKLVDKETHDKHLVEIFRYKEYDWHLRDFTDLEPFPTNYAPVWIHENLIRSIFEDRPMVNGQRKQHTQYELFLTFNKKIVHHTTH